MLLELPKEVIAEFPAAVEIGEDEMITKSDFDLLFKETMAAVEPVNAKKKTRELQQSNRASVQADMQAILKFIKEALDDSKITVEQLFKDADADFSGTLSVEELKEQVKKTLPNHSTGINFKKLMKAFDMNGNGQIDLPEFVNLLDQAGKSNADTSSYHKITESISPGKSKRRPKVDVPDSGPQRLVLKDDRVDSAAVIKYLIELQATEERVGDPIDEI